MNGTQRAIAGLSFVVAAAALAQPAAATAIPPRVDVAAAEPSSKDELFGTDEERKPGSTGEREPASKDDLFGTKPEAKPGSKDDLFGAGKAPSEKPAAAISGSFEALGAYTYAGPSHWSRGLGRLALAAQGETTDKVKWKVSGRLDGDLVFATSDFYLDAVKRNQRFSAVWGENYVDFSAGPIDFRLGAQHIVWGEVVGLFVADVVSARDTREFLLPSFDVIRIPQWAARAEYFIKDAHLELIWIPVPTFDRIGKPGSDFYPAVLPSPTPASVAATYLDPDEPARRLGNSSYGLRGNTLVAGWDLAAFYYRSFSTQPTFYRIDTGDPAQPFLYQPRFDRIWQAGGTVTKDFGEFVFRGEGVYTSGQRYSVNDLTAPQGVVERSTLDYILSIEFPLPSDTRVNLQLFQRAYFDGGGAGIVPDGDGFGGSVFVSTKLTPSLEPQILWIQSFKDAGGMIRPRLNWYAAKNTTVGFGVDIFTGSSDGYFGRYNNRDRVYADVRFDF